VCAGNRILHGCMDRIDVLPVDDDA